MEGVRPLRSNQAEDRPPPPPAEAKMTRLDEESVLGELLSDPVDPQDLECADVLSYQQAGVQHSVLRKLKKGYYSIGMESDMHGLTVDQARAALASFLDEAQRRGIGCVRIIHGKGLGSPGKVPVIKKLLNHWLKQRKEVLAFCSARPMDGGTGAVYVLLKKL